MLWRDRSTVVNGVAAGAFGTAQMGLAGRQGASSVAVASVTTNFFDVLQVRAARGRLFLARDGQPGAPAVIVVSHDAWVRAFASDPQIVGKTFEFSDGGRREIVGVLPSGVSYPLKGHATDVYLPRVLPPTVPANGNTYFLSVVARLRSGVTPAVAQAEMNLIAPAVVTPLHEQVLGPARTWLLLSLAAMAFVLTLALMMVATLLLSQAIARGRDFATRESLGASRARLALDCVVKGFALAGVSTAAGLIIATAGLAYATSALPPGLALVRRIGIDARVVGLTAVVGLIVGGALASTPAWLVWRQNPVTLLTPSGGSIIGDRRHTAWLGTLQVVSLAAAYVLAVATGLVIMSAVHILRTDLGFDWRNVLVVSYERPLDGLSPVARPAAAEDLRQELVARVQAVPGVVSAGIMGHGTLPLLRAGGVRYSIGVDGVDRDGPGKLLLVNVVAPGYFETLKMRIVSGRGFRRTDGRGSRPVIVLNDIAARRLFADQSPLGHIASFRGERAIIGVVRGVRYDGPEFDPEPELYIPVAQDVLRQTEATLTSGSVVVRAENSHGTARAVVNAIAPFVSRGSQVRFLDDAFGRLTALQRYTALVMSLFGVVALLTTGIGVYCTMSLYVSQQIRAIGLRIALGATPLRIMQFVLRRALVLTAIGAGLGLVGSWLTSNLLGSLLMGVQVVVPDVYLGGVVVLGLVAFVGALGPARRAAARDPAEALRQ
jgi:predicted permease